jgi:hypothetical protein
MRGEMTMSSATNEKGLKGNMTLIENFQTFFLWYFFRKYDCFIQYLSSFLPLFVYSIYVRKNEH